MGNGRSQEPPLETYLTGFTDSLWWTSPVAEGLSSQHFSQSYLPAGRMSHLSASLSEWPIRLVFDLSLWFPSQALFP